MARKRLIKSALSPYHVYNRTLDKNFYDSKSMPEIWNHCTELLYEATLIHSAKIHAFTLMSNHFHLLISTPEINLGDIMRDFQSKFCKSILEKTQKQKFRFAGPYKWKIIKNGNHYADAYKYVYQNPVRAGLSDQCETYPYSTLSGVLGNSKMQVPLSPSDLYEWAIPEAPNDLSTWVNTLLVDKRLAAIRKSCVRRRRGEDLELCPEDLTEERL